jgi:3',5'-cyclic AMP phosphodiesterase CpdA
VDDLYTTSVSSAMFVLAHLSDPHLAPLPQPRWSELMGKRITGYAHWRTSRYLVHRSEVLARVVADLKAKNPDHIAVTGDLVNISAGAEYAPARAWLESLGGPRDVTLVPGNHDIYVRGAADEPHSYWGDYMRGDDGAKVTFPFLRRRGQLALIGLSSAVPTAPFMATGRLGEKQIARLMELLDRCRFEQLFRIVLVHHAPVSIRHRHLRRLTDAAKFCDALARCGAELVIHGHDHLHSLSFIDGPQGRIPVLGVPSASQAPLRQHAAGYNLYLIERRAGAWHCEAVGRGFAIDGESIGNVARTTLLQ